MEENWLHIMDAYNFGNLALYGLTLMFVLLVLGGVTRWLLRARHRALRLRQKLSRETETLRSDLRIAAGRLAAVDPEQFREHLARLERDQKLAEADTLVEAYFAEQANAIADAARVMAEREVFLSHNRGADGLPDAVRFAELGLAARPGDPHLGPLLDELHARIANTEQGETATEESAPLRELDDIDLLDMARNFLKRGQYGLAGITARRAAALAHENIGPRTSRYAAALSIQGEALQALGRLDDAVSVMRQAVDIAAETLGNAHPNYLTGLRNLSDLLRRAGRLGEAETCLRRVLTLMEQTVGTHHPDYAADFRELTSLQKEREKSAGTTPLAKAAAAMSQGTVAANQSTEPRDHLFRSRRLS